MGQMTAVGQVHREDAVARLERSEVDRLVGGGAGVRLHVRMFGAVESLGSLDGQGLHLIHDFAAAVVPGTRITLGILVGENASDGLEHSHRGEVLGGDELDVALLPTQFVFDQTGDSGVGPIKGRIGVAGLTGNALHFWWPPAYMLAGGSAARTLLGFVFVSAAHQLEPLGVFAPQELGGQPALQQLRRQSRADDAPPEAQDVGVAVLAGHLRRIAVAE
jgi:hypothetical protein